MANRLISGILKNPVGLRPVVLALGVLILFGLYQSRSVPYSDIQGIYDESRIRFIPKVYNATEHDALPMVIALHGSGDNPKNFLNFFSEFKIPIRVIAVELPKKNPSQSYLDYESAVAHMVAHVISALEIRYPTLSKPSVLGYSLGGNIAYHIARKNPELVSNIICLSGTLNKVGELDFSQTQNTMKIFAFHGNKDVVVSFHGAKKTIAELRNHYPDVFFQEYDGGHEVPQHIIDAVEKILRSDSALN